MIEDVITKMYYKLDIASCQYYKDRVSPTIETATVYNMWLIGKIHFPKLYNKYEVMRINDFMQEAWFKPQQEKLKEKLMKGTQ